MKEEKQYLPKWKKTETKQVEHDKITPTDDKNTPQSVETAEKQAEEQLNMCKEKYSETKDCCRNPLKCLGADVSDSSMGIGAAVGQLLIGLSAGSLAGKGLAKQCEFYKMMGYSTAGISSSIAGACMIKKDTCNDVCEGAKNNVDSLLTKCKANHTSDDCKDLEKLARQTKTHLKRCDGFNAEISYNLQNTINSIAGAKQSELCQKAAEQNETPSLSNQDFQQLQGLDTDCSSPANATNPICRMDCNRPGAENDPLCRDLNINAKAEHENPNFQQQASHTNSQRDDSALGIPDDLHQPLNIPIIDPKGSPVAGSPGGGPGGGPLGGGVGSPNHGSAAHSPSGKEGKGYNTNILKGARGRTGYSRKYGGSSGGFRGYGRGRQRESSNKIRRGQKFDLKKFLPGGKKDPKRRIASLSAHEARQIGRKHIDIWKKINRRYQGICQVGRLQGCKRR